ncbi:hypothetical protein [Dipodfec virus RodF1_43]|uniref:Uncharacterized protein n=1 Tax=Dipodfec virus RodF1_43 TaxID=2929297 RepID=A0A976R5K7_9VIRU|nr:hypothetical protein [Dipodfec virus RodF1_43]
MKIVSFLLANSNCPASVEVPVSSDIYFGFAHYSKTTLKNYLKACSSTPFQLYYQDISPDSPLTFVFPDFLDDDGKIYLFIPGYSSDFSDLFTHPLKFNSFSPRDISVVLVCNNNSKIKRDTILEYLMKNVSFGDCSDGVSVDFSLLYVVPSDGSIASEEKLCCL